MIYDLKPRVARQLTPCLPAYLILAGFRYYDRENDEIAITGLFGSAHTLLKEMAVGFDMTKSILVVLHIKIFILFLAELG